MMRVLLDTNIVLDVFEDNLQIASATIAERDAIITRNPDHFKPASLTVLTPAEALARIS